MVSVLMTGTACGPNVHAGISADVGSGHGQSGAGFDQPVTLSDLSCADGQGKIRHVRTNASRMSWHELQNSASGDISRRSISMGL